MDDALFIAATGMTAYQRLLESAAHNAVHSQTPGFARHRVTLQPFGSFLDKAGGGRTQLIGANESISFDQGDLVRDGNPYSLALSGPGFFEIQDANANSYYTRDGQFNVNAEGVLTTAAGYPVVSESNQPIRIDKSRGPVSIDDKGAISQGQGLVAKLKVVEFTDDERAKLRPMSDTLYAAPGNIFPQQAKATRVAQETLEIPTYTGPQAMVSMISAQRSHEAMRKAITALSDIQERMIRNGQ